MSSNTPTGNDLPDFSNVQSGATSNAETATPTFKIYTIQSGDSLSKIAKREYGNANGWRRIYEANPEVIKNPDKIFAGQVIKIPL